MIILRYINKDRIRPETKKKWLHIYKEKELPEDAIIYYTSTGHVIMYDKKKHTSMFIEDGVNFENDDIAFKESILPTLKEYEIIVIQDIKTTSTEENFTNIMDKYKDLIIALSTYGSIQIKAVEGLTSFSRPVVKEILNELVENKILNKYPTFWTMPTSVKGIVQMRFFGKSMMDTLHNRNIKPLLIRGEIKPDTRTLTQKIKDEQQIYESTQSNNLISKGKNNKKKQTTI